MEVGHSSSERGEAVLTCIGIDPGLVHTGVVSLKFSARDRAMYRGFEIVNGLDLAKIRQVTDYMAADVDKYDKPRIFIEGYRPRSHYDTDNRMVVGVSEIRKATDGKVLNNTGIKKVVRPELLALLGLEKFPTTHHQDLESAARIMALGMIKEPVLNGMLCDIVEAYLKGQAWHVYK